MENTLNHFFFFRWEMSLWKSQNEKLKLEFTGTEPAGN